MTFSFVYRTLYVNVASCFPPDTSFVMPVFANSRKQFTCDTKTTHPHTSLIENKTAHECQKSKYIYIYICDLILFMLSSSQTNVYMNMYVYYSYRSNTSTDICITRCVLYSLVYK